MWPGQPLLSLCVNTLEGGQYVEKRHPIIDTPWIYYSLCCCRLVHNQTVNFDCSGFDFLCGEMASIQPLLVDVSRSDADGPALAITHMFLEDRQHLLNNSAATLLLVMPFYAEQRVIAGAGDCDRLMQSHIEVCCRLS